MLQTQTVVPHLVELLKKIMLEDTLIEKCKQKIVEEVRKLWLNLGNCPLNNSSYYFAIKTKFYI